MELDCFKCTGSQVPADGGSERDVVVGGYEIEGAQAGWMA